MTNDLRQRIYQHRKKLIPGFTQNYTVDKLVYYETTNYIRAANPEWKGLSEGWFWICRFSGKTPVSCRKSLQAILAHPLCIPGPVLFDSSGSSQEAYSLRAPFAKFVQFVAKH